MRKYQEQEKQQGVFFAHMPKVQYEKMSLRSSKITAKRLTQQLLSWEGDLPA